MLSITDNMLRGGYNLLIQCNSEGALSSQNWLAVAKLTKALQVLAKKLKELACNSSYDIDADPNTSYFFNEAQQYCQSREVNDDQTASGPLWYLIRYIVRTYGSISLKEILSNDHFKRILSSENYRQVIICTNSYIKLTHNYIEWRVYRYCCCI